MRPTVALVALAALVLAGCSSSSSHPTHSPAPSSASAPAASQSTDRPADPATTAAIRAAYTIFFSSRSSIDQSQAALQHGASFRAELIKEGQGSNADESGAAVTGVRLAGTDVADVVFDITSNGKTQLSGFTGKAVREGGDWKVAAVTFCALTGLEGTAPSACSNHAITALPS